MRHMMRSNREYGFCTVAMMVAVAVPLARADFSMFWFTLDGGGAQTATGGGFKLNGTVGQPDAGAASGGSFKLSGGFWPGIGGSGMDMCPDRSKTKGVYKPGHFVSVTLVRYAPNTTYDVELLDKTDVVVEVATLTTDDMGRAKATVRIIDCSGAPHRLRNRVCDVSRSVKKDCEA